MERSLFQIVTDEVGSNKTHLQEEQEYLDLRCEGISARCTEVPGKEESNRKWNERCDCPPAFPVAQTFSFFHFFHRFFVRLFYFIYFFLYFICRFLSRKIFFPCGSFPCFYFFTCHDNPLHTRNYILTDKKITVLFYHKYAKNTSRNGKVPLPSFYMNFLPFHQKNARRKGSGIGTPFGHFIFLYQFILYQFVRERIGAGILPPLAMNSSALNSLIFMTGAYPMSPPN